MRTVKGIYYTAVDDTCVSAKSEADPLLGSLNRKVGRVNALDCPETMGLPPRSMQSIAVCPTRNGHRSLKEQR